MNERIKDFLDEATEIHDDRNTGISYPIVDYKIFAELIIKECLSALQTRIDQGEGCGSFEFGQHIGFIRARGVIKKHFGVEQ